MGIKTINEWEKAVVFLLNLDGWDLKHCGDGNSRYDAKGKTPKGKDCIIEMKFRNKYYEDKMLEKDKKGGDNMASKGIIIPINEL